MCYIYIIQPAMLDVSRHVFIFSPKMTFTVFSWSWDTFKNVIYLTVVIKELQRLCKQQLINHPKNGVKTLTLFIIITSQAYSQSDKWTLLQDTAELRTLLHIMSLWDSWNFRVSERRDQNNRSTQKYAVVKCPGQLSTDDADCTTPSLNRTQTTNTAFLSWQQRQKKKCKVFYLTTERTKATGLPNDKL